MIFINITVLFVAVKSDFLLNYLKYMGKFSSYLIEKKLHVLYKKQSVNAVRSNNSLLILILTYLLTAIGFTPSGSSTVHIYTQTIHRTTQLTTDNAINKDKTIKIFCLFIEPHDEDQCL